MECRKYLDIGTKSSYSNITYLQFGIASPVEILEQSVCEVDSTCLRNDVLKGLLGISKNHRGVLFEE